VFLYWSSVDVDAPTDTLREAGLSRAPSLVEARFVASLSLLEMGFEGFKGFEGSEWSEGSEEFEGSEVYDG